MKGILSLVVFLCALFVFGEFARGLRDPFEFGNQVAESSRVILRGVLWDPVQPIAIMGDDEVVVGDLVGDWEVVDIQPGGVVLQLGTRRQFIAPGESTPAK